MLKLSTWLSRMAGIGVLTMAMSAAAQTYPAKPIRLFVPYPPGGGLDVIGRLVTAKMGEAMGQPIVVENRPGASGIVAVDALLKAPADGYTFLLGDLATLALNPILYAKLPYDPFKDLAPISPLVRAALVLVVPTESPANSVNDLIERARATPGKMNYGIPGVGSPHHLAMELLLLTANARITAVGFRGAAPAVQELLTNRLDAMFLDLGSGGQQIRAGKLKPLAAGNRARLAQFPNVPTVAEAGYPGYEAFAWSGFAAAAGTPREIVARLGAEYARAATDPSIKQRMDEIGFESIAGSPDDLTRMMRDEQAKWARVIRDAKITVE